MQKEFARLADLYAPEVAKVYTRTDSNGDAAASLRLKLIAALEHRAASEGHMPKACPSIPTALSNKLSGVGAEALEHVVSKMPTQELRLLSEHREKVTWVEGTNAGRLLLLAASARAAEADPKDLGMAQAFRSFLAEHWPGCVPPMVGDLRAWSERSTRHFHVLPIAWRFVNMPVQKQKRSDSEEDGQ